MYFQFGPEIGYQVFTASSVVNDSGKPQALYGIAIKSDGTAGVATLFDGTSSLGTVVYDVNGTANVTIKDFPSIGQVYPKGLYVSFDTHVTRATVWARQVIT